MNVDMLSAKHGIRFITVTNDVGMEITLCSFGASIYQLKMDLENMVLTPKNFDLYFNNTTYYGMSVGRIAGRVPNGQLVINDKTYQLEQNERTNCLHGGFKGISFRNWRTQIETLKGGTIVSFYLTTKKGDAGFNGKAEYKISYKIYKEENKFEIIYDSYCNEDTYFALTNHTYFNLGHDKDILNHKLKIKANKVSTMSDEDFSINGFIDVDDVHDFREGKLIKKDIKDPSLYTKFLKGYDHRYVFSEVDDNEPQIYLSNGNYRLSITTDFDSVHVYTDGFGSPNDEFIEEDYNGPFRGVALEVSSSTPEFKHKKEHYIHHVKYSFKRKSDEI